MNRTHGHTTGGKTTREYRLWQDMRRAGLLPRDYSFVHFLHRLAEAQRAAGL